MTYREMIEIMMAHRLVVLRGEIDREKQEAVSMAIELLDLQGRDPILLRIDSKGGDFYRGLYIAQNICFARSPVFGLVVGSARSSAFNVLQSCDRRLAYPMTDLMFHGPASDMPLDDPNWLTDEKRTGREWQTLQKSLASRSRQPLKLIRRWSSSSRHFSAEEALKLGFIDEILVPPKKRD